MWWDAKGNNKFYHCTISGGYVVVSARGLNILEDHTSVHCGLEEFLQGSLHDVVRAQMGEKVLKEVLDKVSFIIQQRNSKQTGAAPGGIS